MPATKPSSSNPLVAVSSKKGLDRAAEDLEAAAARHGLTVVAIHDLAPGIRGCRVYEVCHEGRARMARERQPDSAVLIPCRILLNTVDDGTRLVALRPSALLGILEGFEDLAEEMTRTIERALEEAAR